MANRPKPKRPKGPAQTPPKNPKKGQPLPPPPLDGPPDLGASISTVMGGLSALHEALGKIHVWTQAEGMEEESREIDSARVYLEGSFDRLRRVLDLTEVKKQRGSR